MSNADPRRDQLGGWLQAYEPWNDREREHLQSMKKLVESGSAPFHHGHLNPGHFTASAFVLSPDSQSLLLIFHRKLARWLQPGGHVEDDDIDLLAAARREAKEETGVGDLVLARQGIFDVDVHSIPARGDTNSHQHFDVRFLFHAAATTLQINHEVRDARWVPLAEIGKLESDESVLRAVRKLAETPA